VNPHRPRAEFVGVMYAGWGTRYQNLQQSVRAEGRLDARFTPVTGWREGGLIERLPVPASAAGRLRALTEARVFARMPRPDVLWTSCSELALPYLWAFAGPLDCPLVIETDWTVEQQEVFAPWYFGRPPREGLALKASLAFERAVFSRADAFVPISRWAADGLRRLGIADERIHTITPGVDLEAWKPACRDTLAERPLRVLFVGGDFQRKGGDLLLEAVRGPLAGRCELDIVTRDDVSAGASIRVHRAAANSPELRALYGQADIFALPTRAECLGVATIEALASGLPAIVGDIGGTSDVVDHGETGWLIKPDIESVVNALETAFHHREHLAEMGRRARRAAEERFDGSRNDRRLVDLMLDLAERRRRR
jgi:glycosyltransferase involved in cell wall biosynthesis